jgi:hypothetical protein
MIRLATKKLLKSGAAKLKKPHWEITQAEYLELYRGLGYLDYFGRQCVFDLDETTIKGRSERQNLIARQRGFLRKCLNEGKPIPYNVIKDYPDLVEYGYEIKHVNPLTEGVTMSHKKQSKAKSPKPTKQSGKGRPVGGSRFNDSDRDAMKEALQTGTTVKELAEKYNVTVAAIHYQLKKAN